MDKVVSSIVNTATRALDGNSSQAMAVQTQVDRQIHTEAEREAEDEENTDK